MTGTISASAAWGAVAAHAAASLTLLAARAGTVAGGDAAARLAWIGAHEGRWQATWALWAVSSLSYGLLAVVWAARVPRFRALAVVGAVLVVAGLPLDLSGESECAFALTASHVDAACLARVDAKFTRMSVLVANGLYSAGAALLSVASYRSGLFGPRLLALGGLVALVGFALSGAALAGSATGQTVLGALLMALFVPFAALLAIRFSRS